MSQINGLDSPCPRKTESDAMVHQRTDNRVQYSQASNPFPPFYSLRVLQAQTLVASVHSCAAGDVFDFSRALPFSRSQLRYFSRAVKDFSEVVKSSVDSRTDWNMIALCRGQLGEPEAAEEAYRRALAIDPSFKVRATCNRTQASLSAVFRSTTQRN